MFISTVVALSGFFIQNFPNYSWYPYWYLGNPFNFLIGPVVPFLLLVFVRVLNIPVDFSYYIIIASSLIIGSLGFYFFARSLGQSKAAALCSSVFLLIMPFSFLLLKYQNGLIHIAFGFLPWIFLNYTKLINKFSVKKAVLLAIVIAFVLLIDISILLPILIGFAALAFSINKSKAKHLFFLSVLIIFLSLSIATFWYTPLFWLIIAKSSSYAGMPLFRLIEFLFQLLLSILPIVLALLFLKTKTLKLSRSLFFGSLFLSAYLFLTFVRFISDPDFIMDWIGFVLELQFGLAIILGSIFGKLKVQSLKLKVAVKNLKFIVPGIIISVLIVSGWVLVIRELESIQVRNNYQNGIVRLLEKVPLGERVFLSGADVFFANSKIDVVQLRGGADQLSVHPFWADAAFQIREGEDSDLALNWLKALGVSYVLVHDKASQDPFLDFKHPEKFRNFKLVEEEKGEKLYRIENSYIARTGDPDIFSAKKPLNGADRSAVSFYAGSLGREIEMVQEEDKIRLKTDLERGEVVSLAVSYDPHWKLSEGKGRLTRDSFGNILIKPDKSGRQNFVLRFQKNNIDYLVPLILSIAFSLAILRFNEIYPYLSRFLEKLSLGTRDAENEY